MVGVCVGFGRVLEMGLPLDGEAGQVPVMDVVTGLRLVGLGVFVRFGRVFEVAEEELADRGLVRVGGVLERAEGMNALLRVSFDREHGLRFWPDAGLGCGFEVVEHLVLEPVGPWMSASRLVGRPVFEGLVERFGGLVVEDEHLSTLGYRIEPVTDGGGPMGWGGGRSA